MNKHFIKYWLPLIIYLVLIFYTSSLPLNNPQEKEIKKTFGIPNDVYEHVIGYGFLAIISYRLFANSKNKFINKKAITFAILFTILYGIIDEIHQIFVPTRFFEIKDIISNSIGALIIFSKDLIRNKKLTSFLFYLF